MAPATLAKSLAILLGLTLALISISCSPSKAPVLRVAADNAPPFHTIQPDGTVAGLAVDVLSEAARRRGIKIVWVPLRHSNIETAFRRGLVDAWPAVSRTPERDRYLYFTKPWIDSDYYLITRRDSPVSVQRSAGIKLALASYARLRMVAGRFFPRSIPVLRPGHPESLQAFCSGEADAALVDARALDGILLKRPEGCGGVALHLEFVRGASNPVSIASTREAAAVADSLREGIVQLASDGTMWSAVDKWAGFSAAQTRSFFAVREVENRRDLYLFGFTAVGLSALALAWAILRLRRVQSRARDTQRAAADSEARFQAFMDHSPLVGFIKDEQGRMVYLNRRFCDVFGLQPDQCIGKNDFELWPEGTATNLRGNDLSILASGESVEFVETTPTSGGEYIAWLSMKFPFRQNDRTYLGGMCIDITERERAKEALRISEERFRSLFSHATVGIAIADERGALIRVNAAFCRILRANETSCLETSIQDLLDDGTGFPTELLQRRAAAGMTFETRHTRQATTSWTENCVFTVQDTSGSAANIVIIVEDITQRKIAESQLAYQARHDLLTGLTNRRAHEIYLEEQIEHAATDNRKLCLLYVDLDDFKLVNDSLGHEAGDLVLREAGNRLLSLVPDKRSLSRIGGDEFVLVQAVQTRNEALALASRLRLAMEQPFQINGQYIELRASAGLSIYPDDGLDARTLRKSADDAMYAAKRLDKSLRYVLDSETGKALRELSPLCSR